MRLSLTREQVDEVRAALARGLGPYQAAGASGVSVHAVRQIAAGRLVGRPSAPADSAETWVAACMDPGEWASWQEKNRQVAQNQQAPRPCSDCLLGFAAEMRAIGRCNGQPAGDSADEHEEDLLPGETPPAVTEVRPWDLPPAIQDSPILGAQSAAEPRLSDGVRNHSSDHDSLTGAAAAGQVLPPESPAPRWDELERVAVSALIDYLSTGDAALEGRARMATNVLASGQRRRQVDLGRDQLHWSMATSLTSDPERLAEYVRVTQPSPQVLAVSAGRKD